MPDATPATPAQTKTIAAQASTDAAVAADAAGVDADVDKIAAEVATAAAAANPAIADAEAIAQAAAKTSLGEKFVKAVDEAVTDVEEFAVKEFIALKDFGARTKIGQLLHFKAGEKIPAEIGQHLYDTGSPVEPAK
jgi:hypothetical protein